MNNVEDRLAEVEALHGQWRAFLHHHPVGAYFPVGQLDGDCYECHTEWPCAPVLAALAAALGVTL